MNPVAQIRQVFAQRKPAFMPYFTLGYPDYETSLAVVEACAAAGADMMELGIPFSDPLADGPTIQQSTQIALENGMTAKKCLMAVRELRKRGVNIPFMLMGYINPMFAYGLEAFVREAAAAGAHGFIVPDLPPEEADVLAQHCQEQGLALTFLLSPNSSDERIAIVSGRSTGFTYLVSVTGITGARTTLPAALSGFVQRVRAHTDGALAVGFGISTAAQVTAVGEMADGVIVGSALIRAVAHADDMPAAAAAFVRELIDSRE